MVPLLKIYQGIKNFKDEIHKTFTNGFLSFYISSQNIFISFAFGQVFNL